ncbi:MAG: phage portal protein, partial [bacterium]|nr:phage portal protein [bacterium]
MPFEIRKGDEIVYEFDGSTTQTAVPKGLSFVGDIPHLMGLVEIANTLGGKAYIERSKSVMDTDMGFKWLLPWSITPLYNGVPPQPYNSEFPFGDIVRFERTNPRNGAPLNMELDQMLYFWLPDYAVEIGPAKNYPGLAVLNNAGVITGLDLFLQGYFDRGMLAATLLKYKDSISAEEVPRVKEWWRRVFTGVQNAFSTEVVRGDFEVMRIGDGVKDLRDNVLLKDERDAIAVGMGVPPSKLLPVGVNRATKDADDRAFIEDTIIPEIGWIYRTLNAQLFNPLGYSIVALPQQLRVMQSDEVERSAAFRNYVGSGDSPGYTVKEAENILGIYIPQDLRDEIAAEQADILGSDAPGEEKTLLNGIQIQSALSIITDAFGQGFINRDNAINMYDAFLGINPDVARQLIPEKVDKPITTDVNQTAVNQAIEDSKAIDFIALIDKRDERNQFVRWCKNRNFQQIDVNEFKTEHLTNTEKVGCAIDAYRKAHPYKVTELDKLTAAYGDELAKYIDDNLNQSRDAFRSGFVDIVTAGLLSVYRDAVGIGEGDDLSESEQSAFDELLGDQLTAVDGFVGDLYDNKSLTDTRDRLQEFGRNLGARLVMWAGAARQMFNRGLMAGRRDVTLTWRLGATEEHCEDCLRFNGQESSKEAWLKLASAGFYPQSRS